MTLYINFNFFHKYDFLSILTYRNVDYLIIDLVFYNYNYLIVSIFYVIIISFVII